MTNSDQTPASILDLSNFQFYRRVIDSLDAQLAVIDNHGVIQYVNKPWERFASENGAPPGNTDVGVNYLTVTFNAEGEGADHAPEVFTGLSTVLSGASDYFEIDYPCFTPTEELWFVMRAFPLADSQPRWVVVTHHNITRRRRASLEQATAEREQSQQREESSLARLSEPLATDITAQTFGVQPVRNSAPVAFEQLHEVYGALLDRAVEARAYKNQPPLTPQLRDLAERLAFLRAGPRDVVDLHITTLRNKSESATPGVTHIYAEEARLLILELMGHLTSIYRNEAFGIKTTDPEARSL